MPALLLQSEAGGMLANGFTVLCLLSSGSGVERSSGSLPGRPNVVSGVAGTCPRATPVTRRSAVGMAHKRSIRLQCMMSFPTVSIDASLAAPIGGGRHARKRFHGLVLALIRQRRRKVERLVAGE